MSHNCGDQQMKFYSNVLSQSTIVDCVTAVLMHSDKHGWCSSLTSWDAEIKRGILGSVNSFRISGSLYDQLFDELTEFFPESDDVSMQFFVWGPFSGISRHNDEKYQWGGTIYLNERWEIDYGGIFLWEDHDTGELRARVPEFNTMVINDELEHHLVTPVSHFVPEERLTIQLFGT